MSFPLKHAHYLPRNVLPLLSLKTIWKIYTWVVLIIACFIPVSYWSTCPSSNSISNSITSDQCTLNNIIIIIIVSLDILKHRFSMWFQAQCRTACTTCMSYKK